MAQNVVDFSGNPSGSGLMDDYLDKDQQNVLTSNSGIQRPSYAVAGTKWLDTSVTPWLWKMYDGTSDVTLGTVNPSTHLFTPAGVLPSQDGQSGKFLQTNGSNTVWTDAVDYTNITNCITAIPQDIKLELNNGTLTLKAGSKVYVPNGVGVFDEVVINSDTSGMAENGLLYISNAKTISGGFSNFFSGETEPTFSGNIAVWYDTKNNYIKRTNDGGETWISGQSFPICLMKNSSIRQVFNGFGYIGSTIFSLPGVEGLIPNGRNADGSLNNVKFTTTRLYTFTNPVTYNNLDILINSTNISETFVTYNSKTNFNEFDSNKAVAQRLQIGTVSRENGRITSFNPKTAFHAADYQDVPKLAGNNVFTGINLFNGGFGNNAEIYLENTHIDRDVNPSSIRYCSFLIRDKNGKQLANFYCFQNVDGSITTNMIATGRDGKDSGIAVARHTNGQTVTYVPTPPAGDNSTQIATTAFVNSFITNLSSTLGSGYVYVGNLLIQWGTWNEGTTTFPKPFANTNYGMAILGGYTANNMDNWIKSASTTGFTAQKRTDRITKYITIGQRG